MTLAHEPRGAPHEPAASSSFAGRLNTPVTIAGHAFVVITQEIVTVRKAVPGPSRASAAIGRDATIRALDLLFAGF